MGEVSANPGSSKAISTFFTIQGLEATMWTRKLLSDGNIWLYNPVEVPAKSGSNDQ